MNVGDKVRYKDFPEVGEVVEQLPHSTMVIVRFPDSEMWTHPENLTVIEEGHSSHE